MTTPALSALASIPCAGEARWTDRLARGLLKTGARANFTPTPGGIGLPGLRCQENLTTESAVRREIRARPRAAISRREAWPIAPSGSRLFSIISVQRSTAVTRSRKSGAARTWKGTLKCKLSLALQLNEVRDDYR